MQPLVAEDMTTRVAILEQQMLSETNLQPLVQKVWPGKNSQEVDQIIDNIRLNVKLEPVITSLSAIGVTAGEQVKPGQSPVPGFYLDYTAARPRVAQQICTEWTALLINENLKSMQAAASGTSELLSPGLEDAKHNLDDWIPNWRLSRRSTWDSFRAMKRTI